jgi:predicted transposase YbfD/YdcC
MPYTPKKTVKAIIDSGNDYLIAVKSNQASLYRQVKAIASDCKPRQCATSQEQQRGRQEHRQVSAFAPTGIDTERWPGVKTLLCIERKRSVKGKCSTQRSYYISSVATTAVAWMKMIRGHWCIENRLHWPKDVVLDEDASYGREPNALLNASVFRSITINLLRLNGFDSPTAALRELANQVKQIFRLLQ